MMMAVATSKAVVTPSAGCLSDCRLCEGERALAIVMAVASWSSRGCHGWRRDSGECHGGCDALEKKTSRDGLWWSDKGSTIIGCLCAEVVHVEMEKNGGKREKALEEHVNDCVRFNWLGRSYPALCQAEDVKETLRCRAMSTKDYKTCIVQ
ncbi:hypothetical protein V8G54_003337 [Vigna mungo]|uniref:Uncharacterized protein n=1 Tax=Vigna mungo TaxID=3915 RepID=A0AAQ3PAS5_VIGMU